jgi:hypothetical protein
MLDMWKKSISMVEIKQNKISFFYSKQNNSLLSSSSLGYNIIATNTNTTLLFQDQFFRQKQ